MIWNYWELCHFSPIIITYVYVCYCVINESRVACICGVRSTIQICRLLTMQVAKIGLYDNATGSNVVISSQNAVKPNSNKIITTLSQFVYLCYAG